MLVLPQQQIELVLPFVSSGVGAVIFTKTLFRWAARHRFFFEATNFTVLQTITDNIIDLTL